MKSQGVHRRVFRRLRLILEKNEQVVSLVAMLVVVAVPVYLTFAPGELIAWGDMELPELGAGRGIEHYFYAWQRWRGLGAFITLEFPVLFPHYLLTWLLTEVLGLYPYLAQALLYLFSFELAALSTFFLVRELLPQRRRYPAALVAGLLYVFNLSFLQITWSGNYKFVFFHAVLPLFLLTYAKGLRSGDRKYLAWWGILLFVCAGAFRPLPLIVPLGGVLVAFTLFAAYLYGRRVWKLGVQYALVALLVSAMWLLPIAAFILEGGGTAFEGSSLRHAPPIVWSYITDSHRFVNLFRLLSWWWFRPEGWASGQPAPLFPFAQSYLEQPVLLLGSYLLPILAFSSLLFTRRELRGRVIFFSMLTLVALLLSKGPAPPLPQVFMLLTRLPFFTGLFRNPFTKFQYVFALGYAVLVGIALNTYRLKLSSKLPKRASLWSGFLFLTSGALLLALVFPYWSGQVIRPRRVVVPDTYYAAASWLNSDTEAYRVLSLPFHNSHTYIAYQWGYAGASGVMPYLLDRPIFLTAPAVGSTSSDRANRLLRRAVAHEDGESLSTLLYLYGMGKILFHNDADPARYNDAFVARQLQRPPTGRAITFERSFGSLDVYDVDALPHLYAATDVDCMENGSLDAVARVPFSLLRSEGAHTVLLHSCEQARSQGSTLSHPRVFAVAEGSFEAGRCVFSMTLPTSADYALFSTAPISYDPSLCSNCNFGPGDREPVDWSEKYDRVGTLAAQQGTYLFWITSEIDGDEELESTCPREVVVARSTQTPERIGSPPRVEYEMMNPTRYRIQVQGATSPYLLVLGETYHPAWRVFLDGQVLDASVHREVNGYANAWLIERAGDYEVEIAFTYQRFVYLGLAISISTVLVCIVCLLYWRRMNGKL